MSGLRILPEENQKGFYPANSETPFYKKDELMRYSHFFDNSPIAVYSRKNIEKRLFEFVAEMDFKLENEAEVLTYLNANPEMFDYLKQVCEAVTDTFDSESLIKEFILDFHMDYEEPSDQYLTLNLKTSDYVCEVDDKISELYKNQWHLFPHDNWIQIQQVF